MIVMAAVSSCGVSGGDGGDETPSDTTHQASPTNLASLKGGTESILRELVSYVDCSEVVSIPDDMYFWDSMKGADCYAEDGEVTTLRVYEHKDSAANVLQDWDALISVDRPLLYGERWFVVGDPVVVEDLARRVESLAGPTVDVPKQRPISAARERMGMCVRFATSSIASIIEGTNEFTRDAPSLDKHYPGFSKFVPNLLKSTNLDELQSLSDDQPLKFEAKIAEFGPDVKKFCEGSS